MNSNVYFRPCSFSNQRTCPFLNQQSNPFYNQQRTCPFLNQQSNPLLNQQQRWDPTSCNYEQFAFYPSSRQFAYCTPCSQSTPQEYCCSPQEYSGLPQQQYYPPQQQYYPTQQQYSPFQQQVSCVETINKLFEMQTNNNYLLSNIYLSLVQQKDMLNCLNRRLDSSSDNFIYAQIFSDDEKSVCKEDTEESKETTTEKVDNTSSESEETTEENVEVKKEGTKGWF